ncbi:hypothetical protein SLAGATHOR_79 [Mycobacterium phage Slagathor]|nr:hypothetical protein SEA_ARCANINE_82 [Mycobacterium phage Arcanine]UYE90100.1 hypothetical protein PBI_MOLLY_79 [Mycobacterium phage Molly]WGH20279.1 hypothetical protein SLAGATHOR_79 [Mycobacterium phage Slagathor]
MSGEWFETEYGAWHSSDNWQLVALTDNTFDLHWFDRAEATWRKVLNTDRHTAEVYVDRIERREA